MIKNLFTCSFFIGSQCKGIIFRARSLYTKFGRSYHFFRKVHWISTILLFLYPFLSVLTEYKLGEPCLHLLLRVGSTDGAPYEPEFLQVGDTRDTKVGLHGSHQSTYSAHLVSAEGNDRPALQLLTVCVVERVHIHRDIEPPDRTANEDIVVLAEVSVCFFQWRTCIGIFFIPCNGVGQRIVVSGVRYSGFYAIDVTTRLPLYLFILPQLGNIIKTSKPMAFTFYEKCMVNRLLCKADYT